MMSVATINKQGSTPVNLIPKKKKTPLVNLLHTKLKKKERSRKLDTVADQAQRSYLLFTPIRRLNCFTTYAENHSALIQKHFSALTNPLQSVAHLIMPLRSFAKQLPITDPEFTIVISSRVNKTLKGICNYEKKRIHLLDFKTTHLRTTLL